LTAYIEHSVLKRAEIKDSFSDTGGTKSCSENILIAGDEVSAKQAVEVDEEAISFD
jgi:hypothetical protein